MMTNYQLLATNNVPIKAWTRGVPFEDEARQQLANVATLPFIHQLVAVMPDVHVGMRRDGRLGDRDARARSSRRRSASTSAAA